MPLKGKHKQMYLVVDDLSSHLQIHPILVPIPARTFDATDEVVRTRLVAFTRKVYKDITKLGYFECYHSHKDIIVDGFDVRFNKIYPNIST